MAVLKRGFDDIRCANEFGHEAVPRLEITLTRRTDLGKCAFVNHDNPVAKLHGLGLIVRHINRGDAERAQQAIEFATQTIAERGVERGQRIVEQQDARTNRYRARQRNPLTLTAGELIDATVLQPVILVNDTSSATRAARSFLAI